VSSEATQEAKSQPEKDEWHPIAPGQGTKLTFCHYRTLCTFLVARNCVSTFQSSRILAQTGLRGKWRKAYLVWGGRLTLKLGSV